VGSHSAKEWSPKNERWFFGEFHVKHHEIDGDEVVLDFHWNIFCNSRRVAD
jgi:hypothetical protein